MPRPPSIDFDAETARKSLIASIRQVETQIVQHQSVLEQLQINLSTLNCPFQVGDIVQRRNGHRQEILKFIPNPQYWIKDGWAAKVIVVFNEGMHLGKTDRGAKSILYRGAKSILSHLSEVKKCE